MGKIASYWSKLTAARARGWDDAIRCVNSNPYSRSDYSEQWQRGYSECMRGDDMPNSLRRYWGYEIKRENALL